MFSGWSTHGKLACPYCMENNKAFTLINGGKTLFFYHHRRFLPPNHRYRKDFFVGRVEKDVASPRLSGEELHDVVLEYGDIVFGLQSGKHKFSGFGLTHYWVKRSIYWELSYWKTNFFRHNLDVMHIEKNVFENIFNIIVVTHFLTPCARDGVYLFWTKCRSLAHVCWRIDKSRERNIFFRNLVWVVLCSLYPSPLLPKSSGFLRLTRGLHNAKFVPSLSCF